MYEARLRHFLDGLTGGVKVGEVTVWRKQLDHLGDLEATAIKPDMVTDLRRRVLVDDGTGM